MFPLSAYWVRFVEGVHFAIHGLRERTLPPDFGELVRRSGHSIFETFAYHALCGIRQGGEEVRSRGAAWSHKAEVFEVHCCRRYGPKVDLAALVKKCHLVEFLHTAQCQFIFVIAAYHDFYQCRRDIHLPCTLFPTPDTGSWRPSSGAHRWTF